MTLRGPVDGETESVMRVFIRERFKGKAIVGAVHVPDDLTEEDWDSSVLMTGAR